ncbi:MAG: M4 family metallopeptidase [Bacteroidetes bacterium]|nr:M4 family metallopeptidase [Bacteroidota bacterium]
MSKPMRILSYHAGAAGGIHVRGHDPMHGHVFGDDLDNLDPVSAARFHLDFLVVGGGLWMEPMDNEEETEFVDISFREWPKSATRSVKFRQTLHGIAVYGSSVAIEMDSGNNLIAVNGVIAPSIDVDPRPRLSGEMAFRIAHGMPEAQELTDEERRTAGMLQLYYYRNGNDPESNKRPPDAAESERNGWMLVYRVGNVVPMEDSMLDAGLLIPVAYDCLVDANFGEVVLEIPCSPDESYDRWSFVGPGDADAVPAGVSSGGADAGATWEDDPENGEEILGMLPEENAISVTCDFGYLNILNHGDLLPGERVYPPYGPDFDEAHRNLTAVANYLMNILGHRGIDGHGKPIVSSMYCVYGADGPEWRNSAWLLHRMQAVFGQIVVDGRMRSFAVARDIVAHEVFHGVTQHMARLDYLGQSGALNESYSDIFAVIILNAGRADIAGWDWELGRGLGSPVRSMKEPGKYRYTVQDVPHPQPDHMDAYVDLPGRRFSDWGGVHVNSGIHNKAAYNILTAMDHRGRYLFEPNLVAEIFYKALVDGIYQQATFSESRLRVENVAITSLLSDPRAEAKLAAIARAFDDVGIPRPGAAR